MGDYPSVYVKIKSSSQADKMENNLVGRCCRV